MEVVIKIDEKDYQSLKDGHIPFNVLDVIMNGTILPKGHGRLGDLDRLSKKFLRKDVEDFNGSLEALAGWCLRTCNHEDTIVEAESEE